MRKEENGEACGDRSSPLLVRMKEKVCVKIRLENKGMRGPMKGDGGNDCQSGAKKPLPGIREFTSKVRMRKQSEGTCFVLFTGYFQGFIESMERDEKLGDDSHDGLLDTLNVLCYRGVLP